MGTNNEIKDNIDYEDSLLPLIDTKSVLNFAVELGESLLRNGAEVYRVEDTVVKIVESYGITDFDVYVLSNGIFASANEKSEDSSSVIRHVPLGAHHLGRIIALNQLSRQFCSHEISLSEAWKELEKAKKIPFYPDWVMILSTGLGSFGFCYLYKGTMLDSLGAFVVGFVLEAMLIGLKKHKTSKFTSTILGAALATVLAVLLHSFFNVLNYDKIIIGAIMILVPGIAMTTSIRDFFNGDYLSGSIHMIDALLIGFCIATGVGVVITLLSMVPGGFIAL